MNEIIIIGIFALLFILQGIERYLYQKDMTNKLNDTIKAGMARNLNEYLAATTQLKSTTKIVEQDQVDFNADNPEEFDKAIKKMIE